jgi:hypothetical protein
MPNARNDRDDGEHAQEKDECVEVHPRRSLGQARLTDRCDRRQHGGEHHGADGPDDPQDEVPNHGQRHHLALFQPQGGEGAVVLALHDALAGQRLADDKEPDQRSQDRQYPPPDGLRMDRRLDRCVLLLETLETFQPVRAQRIDISVQSRKVGRAVTEV